MIRFFQLWQISRELKVVALSINLSKNESLIGMFFFQDFQLNLYLREQNPSVIIICIAFLWVET